MSVGELSSYQTVTHAQARVPTAYANALQPLLDMFVSIHGQLLCFKTHGWARPGLRKPKACNCFSCGWLSLQKWRRLERLFGEQ